MFKLILGPQPRRFLKKCNKEIYGRIMDKLDELVVNPFPSDVKRVVGKKQKAFRIRVGNHRIQYLVFYEKKELLIFDLDKRPRAY